MAFQGLRGVARTLFTITPAHTKQIYRKVCMTKRFHFQETKIEPHRHQSEAFCSCKQPKLME